jgi:hypothetical protein
MRKDTMNSSIIARGLQSEAGGRSPAAAAGAIAVEHLTKRYADIILPEGGENAVAIDLLRSAILNATGL